MIPRFYGAITGYGFLNDGTYTHGLVAPVPQVTLAKRYYTTLGGQPFDVRGGLASQRTYPYPYSCQFLFVEGDLFYGNCDNYVVALEQDVGKEGLFSLWLGTTYTAYWQANAHLKSIGVHRPLNEMDTDWVRLTLNLEILEAWTTAVLGG